MSKHIIIEDWERLSDLDKIYLQEEEEKRKKDQDYWEFVALHEGKIIVEKDESEEEHKTVVISDYKLPF